MIKNHIFRILFISTLGLAPNSLKAQYDSWVQKADYAGGKRQSVVAFTIGDKAYLGTGDSIGIYPNTTSRQIDFWEFDPGLNTWSQLADFGGEARTHAVGFALNGKGYIGTGVGDLTRYRDFWQYDVDSNSWTQRADFGGIGRGKAVGFSVGGKGYIGGGDDAPAFGSDTSYEDYWQYDPLSDTWTQIDDGPKFRDAACFVIGNKAYVGTGGFVTGGITKEFWELNSVTNTWTRKADFEGPSRDQAVAFSIGNKGYIGTGFGYSMERDVWEYDTTSNSWTRKTNFPGSGLIGDELGRAVGFSVGSKGYIATGTAGSLKQTVWEYTQGITGITENDSQELGINIYPNPADSYIKIDNDQEYATLKVNNVLGQCVLMDECPLSGEWYLDISELFAGTYHVTVESGDRKMSTILVVH